MATGPGMGSGCPRVGNDVRIGYLLNMTFVAESIDMPRVRVRRFRACHRKRALWKKSRVDRRVGGDPVNGRDDDGRWFGIDDAIAAGVGFVAGAGVAIYKGYSPMDKQFWGYAAGGAAIAWVSYSTAGTATAAMGGGFWATTAGGAAAGAISGAGQYTLNSGIETGFNDFNAQDFAMNTAIGAATGAVVAGTLYGVGSLIENSTNKPLSDKIGNLAGDQKVPINAGTIPKDGAYQPSLGSVAGKATIGISKESIKTVVSYFGVSGMSHLGATIAAGPGSDLAKFGGHLWLNKARGAKDKLLHQACGVDGISDWCPDDYREPNNGRN